MRNTYPFLFFIFGLLLKTSLLAQGELRPETVVQFGHPGFNIDQIIIAPDNELMATSDGEFLKLWDMSTRLELRTFRGDMGGLTNIAFSTNTDTIFYQSGHFSYAKSVATGALYYKIDLVKQARERMRRESQNNAETYEPDSKINLPNPFRRKMPNEESVPPRFAYITDSPYNDLRAGVTYSDTIILFRGKEEDPDEVQFILRDPPTEGERGSSVSPNIDIMSLLSGNFDDPYSSYMGMYYGYVRFSPDNTSLLLDTIMYDIDSGDKRFTFSPHENGLLNATAYFMPGTGDLIFCGQPIPQPEEEKAPMTDEEKAEEEKEDKSLKGMALAVQKAYQVPQDTGYTVIFVDGATGELTLPDHQLAGVQKAEFIGDGTYFSTAHHDKSVQVWNWQDRTKHFEIRLRSSEQLEMFGQFGIREIIQTSDKKSLIISCSGSIPEDRLTIWDIESGRRLGNFGAAIPPINLEVIPSSTDTIVMQEYEEYLFPLLNMSHREYGPYRLLSLTNGQAPGVFPVFDSVTFSPRIDYYLNKEDPQKPVNVYGSRYNDFRMSLNDSEVPLNGFTFSHDAQQVAAYDGENIQIWNMSDVSRDFVIPDKKSWELLDVTYSPRDDYLVCSYRPMRLRFYLADDPTYVFCELEPSIPERANYNTKIVARKLKELSQALGPILDDLDGLMDLTQVRGVKGRVDFGLLKILKFTSLADNLIFQEYYDVEISPDGRYAAAWRDDMISVQFIDLEEQEKMALVQDTKFRISSFANTLLGTEEATQGGDTWVRSYMSDRLAFRKNTAIHPDWTHIAVATKHGEDWESSLSTTISNFGKRKEIDEEEEVDENLLSIKIIPIDAEQKKMDIVKGVEIPGTYYLEDSDDYGQGIIFSPDGQYIAASSNGLNKIRIWHADDGRIYKTLDGHSGTLSFTSNGDALVSSGWDRQIKIWNIEEEIELYSFVAIKGENEYINILPSGYYSTSRKNTNAIAFAYGKDAYPFDQFDLQFHRPDSVLQAMGNSIISQDDQNANSVLIAAFNRSYLKRLERMGLTDTNFDNYISLPTIKVADHPFASKDRDFSLMVSAADKRYKLTGLTVKINGVPVLENGSKDLSPLKKSEYIDKVSFRLSEGINHIQVYVTNENGLSSLKYHTTVEYTGPILPKVLHIVTLGTSEFVDSTYNLDFATQDLVDFRKLYSQRDNEFEGVKFHTYEDDKFTLSNFRQLATLLSQLPEDDVVVCYISTHGLLDDQLDYYLATYDIDFEKPSNRGLSYDELHDFLLKINARNKLVFLDACHSGELESKDIDVIYKDRIIEEDEVEFATRGAKAARSTGWEQLPGQQSFDLMKDIFVDLKSETGATVFASASAVQYAFENEEWRNSAMTYCLRKVLDGQGGDANGDGVVTINEMQEYLAYSVPRLTNNLQRPISREENIFNNFIFWRNK